MDYEIPQLIESLVDLRQQLILNDVPSNLNLLKLVDEKLEYLIPQINTTNDHL